MSGDSPQTWPFPLAPSGLPLETQLRRLSVVGNDERRLAAPMVESLLEPVERHTEPDERREGVRPAPPCRVERVDGSDPVAPLRIDAAEDDAVLENGVEREHAALDAHDLLTGIDPEQAGDAAAPQQAERVGHQLRVPRGLDPDRNSVACAHRGS